MRAIVDREFFGFARTKRFFVLRTLVFLIPFLLLLGTAGRAQSLPNDVVGAIVLRTTFFSILLAVLFLTPGMLAPVLPHERQRNRLDVLRSTPLSGARLVLGKYASRVGLVLLMTCAALSLPALSLLYGGVSNASFLRGAATIVATVLWIGAAALFVSARRVELGAASRAAYVWTALWCVLPLIVWPLLTFGSVRGGLLQVTGLIVLCVNPFLVLGAEVFGAGRGTGFAGIDPFLVYLGFSVSATVLLLLGAVRRVRSDPRPRRGAPRPVPEPELGTSLAEGAGGSLVRGARADLSALDEDPLRWLEERGEAARRRRARRILAIVILEIGFLLFWGVSDNAGFSSAMVGLTAGSVAIFVALLEGAVAFRRDHEANTLDVLHASPLPSRDLADAKVSAAMGTWRGWAILASAHVLFAVVAGGGDQFVLVCVSLATLWMLVHALACAALQIGLTAPSTSRALTRVFGWGVGLLLVLPAILLTFGAAGDSDAFLLLLGWHPVSIGLLPFWWSDGPGGAAGDLLRVGSLLYLGGYVALAFHLRLQRIPRTYERLREDERPRRGR